MPRFDYIKFTERLYAFNPNLHLTLKDGKEPFYSRDIVICNCNKCGGSYETTPNNLLTSMNRNGKYKGCRICSGQLIQKGINDFATLHPELMKYIVDPKEVEGIGISTNIRNKQNVLVRCDICGHKRRKNIYDFVRYGVSCELCSSKISIPNRFLRNVMIQFPTDFLKFEYSSDWTKGKIYDCYFEKDNRKFVVEMDGEQHFRDAFYHSKQWSEENDNLKDTLAKNNNVIMIRINCKNTDFDILKKNMCSSQLGQIFDFNTVDWNVCKNALKTNLLKEICDTYKTGKYSTKEIAERFNVSYNSVIRSLRVGTSISLLSLKSNELRIKELVRSRGKSQKVYDADGNFLFNCESISECKRKLHLTGSQTDKICFYQTHGEKSVKIGNYIFERI